MTYANMKCYRPRGRFWFHTSFTFSTPWAYHLPKGFRGGSSIRKYTMIRKIFTALPVALLVSAAALIGSSIGLSAAKSDGRTAHPTVVSTDQFFGN